MPDIDVDFEDSRRDEVIAYVSRKYGTDHVAQIITFGTMLARAAIRDVGRVLGQSYGEVDRIAKAVPNQLGIRLEEALDDLRRAEGALRRRARGEAGHRLRPPARGRCAQRVDPRRRRRHLARAADRADAAPARHQLRRAHDPVRDARRRGAGPAQVRLPRPLEPHDPAPGRRPHPRDARRDDRPRDDPARRRTGRSSCSPRARRRACSSWSPRACAATSATCARRRSTTSRRWSRSTAPGRWTTSRPTSGASTARSRSRTSTRCWSRTSRRRTGSSCTRKTSWPRPWRLGGFTGPEADTLGYAIRKKKSSVLRSMREQFVTQAAERGVSPERHRRGVQGVRAVRAVRVQQGARHLLRPHRVPDRVPQGELHRRVHDLGADRSPRHRREGRRSDRRMPPARHRGPAARRPPLGRRVHRRGRRDPVRPAGRQERGPGRDRVDRRGARGGEPVPLACGLLLAHRHPARQPQGARVARQGRRAQGVRAPGPDPRRPRRCRRRRAGGAARPDQRPDVAVRHGGRRVDRAREAAPRTSPRSRSAAGSRGRRNCSGSTCRIIRSATSRRNCAST